MINSTRKPAAAQPVTTLLVVDIQLSPAVWAPTKAGSGGYGVASKEERRPRARAIKLIWELKHLCGLTGWEGPFTASMMWSLETHCCHDPGPAAWVTR